MAAHGLAGFGSGVRALRKKRGWTQEKLAEMSNLDPTYISGIERGKRNLGYRNLMRLARAFGMRGSELVAEGERQRQIPKTAALRRRRRRISSR